MLCFPAIIGVLVHLGAGDPLYGKERIEECGVNVLALCFEKSNTIVVASTFDSLVFGEFVYQLSCACGRSG